MANFNIVENYSHEHKFEDFKEDYIHGMSKKDLRAKYDIPNRVWFEWKERMPHRLHCRNRRPPRPRKTRNSSGYCFRKRYTGSVNIIRQINGKEYSYGAYPSQGVAEMVAEHLIANDWDDLLAYDLLMEYGMPNSKRVLSKRLLRGRDYDCV